MGDLTRSVGVVVMVITAIVGCSPKRYAINTVSDILSSGDSVYENDDDIILVGEALPFGLKFVESMLAQSPDHRGLLLTASRGYVLYSYAYVDFDSEQVAQKNLSESRELRSRARKLYLRALDYSLRAIDVTYPGFSQQLPVDPEVAVARVGTRRKDLDIASLYWAAASLGLAISVSKNNTSMLARLPEVDALVQRAFVIEPDWNKGVLH
ncbi:MAG: TRAP transporter TatT component family protein, partial [Gammaproteobacteria bacterium]|nr:TRAP transporter TatT component family protein [Gammaproteobacteria bacterium]